jgi:hypothetical protein
MKKYLIPFTKRTLRFMLINLLFHFILRHNEVVFDDTDNVFHSMNNSV